MLLQFIIIQYILQNYNILNKPSEKKDISWITEQKCQNLKPAIMSAIHSLNNHMKSKVTFNQND